MTETEKAKRESVAIGSLSVEGFQMPDGSYRMSLSSAAAAALDSKPGTLSIFYAQRQQNAC